VNEANLHIATCGICGASADLLFRRHWAFKAPATFDIFHCSNCDTNFAAPMAVDSSVYDLIYRNAAKVPGYARYDRYRSQLTSGIDALTFLSQQEDIYWSIAQVLRQWDMRPKSTCRILEVGSGLGYLTYALHQAGYDCRGIDLSEQAVMAAKRNFGDLYSVADLMQIALTDEGGYDLLIATELIEHVTTPSAFIQQATRLLKPGGSLILTTPNKEIYSRRYVWHTDPAPIHLWWFSKTSLRYMAWQHNLSTSFVDFSTFYGAREQKNYGATKPQTFDQNGAVIFSDTVFNSFVRACLAQLPTLFRTLAKAYICARALGRMRSERYRDSLSLCVVMQKQAIDRPREVPSDKTGPTG
jgi:2-polyprenyl-3-methyl-5-hydroxy-6-metoxy-1,4-benzoquinol methylase